MGFSKLPGVSPEMLKVFETVPALYLILSRELIILTASDQYLQATAKKRADIQGKYIFDVFPVDEKKEGSFRVRSSLLEVIQTKKPFQLPITRFDLSHPDNKDIKAEHYWHTLHTPVLNEAGEILYIIHSTTDVTTQVIAEKKLKISLQKQTSAASRAAQLSKRLEKLFADLPARIAILSGPNFIYEFINPIYHQHFGYRDLIGKPLTEALPELREHPIVDELRKVYKTGITYEGKEVRISLSNIEDQPPVDHYFNIMYQARLDENGKVNGILSFAYDITELVYARKDIEKHEQLLLQTNQNLAQANEELQASMEELMTANEDLNNARKKLQTLNANLEQQVDLRTKELERAKKEATVQRDRLNRFFMQSPAGICILDGPEFVFELVNPAYQELFPGRHLTGKTLLQALPELRGQTIPEILQRVYRTGKTFEGTRLQAPFIHTDKGALEDRYFNFIYQARHNSEGQIDGILVFVFEVTAMVIAEKRLKEEQKRKDEFLSIASHELKTPLTSIKAFNQLMQQTDDPVKLRNFIDKSAENIWRLNKLISDLLDVTKINSGKMQYNMEAFSFDEMLKHAIENIQLITTSHQLVVKNNEPVNYYGDRIRIEQVVSNFLNNAIKYSPTKQWVVVSSKVDNNRIVVSIQDFGIGIAPKDLEHISDRYYRVDSAKMRFEGLGLGLFISSEILKRHGGTFWVESEPERGSIFYFALPLDLMPQ